MRHWCSSSIRLVHSFNTVKLLFLNVVVYLLFFVFIIESYLLSLGVAAFHFEKVEKRSGKAAPEKDRARYQMFAVETAALPLRRFHEPSIVSAIIC